VYAVGQLVSVLTAAGSCRVLPTALPAQGFEGWLKLTCRSSCKRHRKEQLLLSWRV
jgi:hypothetical protein